MSDPVASRALKLAMLNRAAAVGGPLNAAQLVLAKAPFTPGSDLAVADLTPADFDGYAAAAALAYGSSYVAPDGTTRIGPPSVQFEATGATVENVIYGWAVLNTAGTSIEYSALLDEPVTISRAGDGLVIDPEYIVRN